VAVAVRRPAGRHARIPDRAIVRVLRPLAVAIQLLVARHVGGHVAARGGVLPLLVTREGPFVEGILAGALEGVLAAAGDDHHAAGLDGDAAVGRFHECVAAEHGEARLVAILVHVQAIAPVRLDHEQRMRRVEGDVVVAFLVANAQVHGAAGDATVEVVLVQA
jgi:hypothetical protein